MRGRLIVGTILLAGAAYFALFGGEYSMLEIARIRHEKGVEQMRYRAVHSEVTRLQARVDSLEDDVPTIQRIARERWGLILPGERLYRFDASPPDTTVADTGDAKPVDAPPKPAADRGRR